MNVSAIHGEHDPRGLQSTNRSSDRLEHAANRVRLCRFAGMPGTDEQVHEVEGEDFARCSASMARAVRSSAFASAFVTAC